jgi:thermitase
MALTLSLLVGCGSPSTDVLVPSEPGTAESVVPVVPGPPIDVNAPVVLGDDGQVGDTPTASFPYAVTLKASSSDTPQALQKAYNAKLISFQPAEGFALLAANTNQLPTDPVHAPVVEKNANTISGGGMTATISGSARTWAKGSFSSWASGSARTWAKGEYSPLPENTTLWKQVHLEQAQALATRLGAGVKVAIIDTGIDPNHPAFAGALAPRNEWRDFYDADADPSDVGVIGQGGYGHGSNTAGIVLQIAPKAIILPLRALGPDGGGDVLSIARAIDWAVARGSNIINLSLGSTEKSQAIQDAIVRANRKGVLVTASAGNENRPKLDYPAADAARTALTLSVGSVNSADLKSGFSNYSGTLELTAPGETVFGPAPGQNAQGGWNMAAWSGTSMSAPMAAGTLALGLGELGAPKNTVVSTLLAERLLITSVIVDGLSGNKPFYRQLGFGRLDIGNFIQGTAQNSGDQQGQH